MDAGKATEHVREPKKSSKKMQVVDFVLENIQKQAFRIVKRIQRVNVCTPPNCEAQNASLETLLGLMPGTKMESLRL